MRRTHFFESIDAASIAEIVGGWKASGATTVLAMLPEREAARVPTLQAACAAAGVSLVGAIFPALIIDDRFVATGACLARIERVVASALLTDVPRSVDGVHALAERLVSTFEPHLDGDDALGLCLFIDSMNPCAGSLLDELYRRLGNRVRYIGTSAGSETFQPTPCLFDRERFVGDGVLAVLQRDPDRFALAHGYPVPSRLTTTTSTIGNRIVQIDWRPAFEVYRELAAAEYGVTIDRSNFYEYAVHFPFGLVRANGEILVRIPVALEEDGSLFCVGEVPSHSLLALLNAPQLDVDANAATLARELVEQGATLDADSELVIFYCAGRRLHLGIPTAREELATVRRHARGATLRGALSLGEIGAPASAYPTFHNASLVLSRLGST